MHQLRGGFILAIAIGRMVIWAEECLKGKESRGFFEAGEQGSHEEGGSQYSERSGRWALAASRLSQQQRWGISLLPLLSGSTGLWKSYVVVGIGEVRNCRILACSSSIRGQCPGSLPGHGSRPGTSSDELEERSKVKQPHSLDLQLKKDRWFTHYLTALYTSRHSNQINWVLTQHF